MERYDDKKTKELLEDKQRNYMYSGKPGMFVEEQTLRTIYPNDAQWVQVTALFGDFLLQFSKGNRTDRRLNDYEIAFEIRRDRNLGMCVDVLLIPKDKKKYTPRRLFTEKELEKDWRKEWDGWLNEVHSGHWAFNQLAEKVKQG